MPVATLESLPDDVLWCILAEAAVVWSRYSIGRAIRYRAICRNLRRLFDDRGYAATTALYTLRYVPIEQTQLARLTHLTRLTGLADCVTDAHLALLPRLRHLKLPNCRFSSDVFHGLSELRSLTLRYYHKDLDLRALTQLTKLVLLDDRVLIEPATFAHLTALKTLRVPSGQEIGALESLTRLRELNLGDVDVDDAQLSRLTSLERLTLGGDHRITDDGMRRMTNLKVLDLSFDDRLTGWAVLTLTRLTNLVISDPGPMWRDEIQLLLPQSCVIDVWQHY